jgi:hypothetical protein
MLRKGFMLTFTLMLICFLFSYIIPLPSVSLPFINEPAYNLASKNTPLSCSEYPIYQMEVTDEGNRLSGFFDLLFINKWDEPLLEIQLNLPANIIGTKNITVDAVKINNRTIDIIEHSDKIVLPLAQPLAPGETLIISMNFKTYFLKNFPRFGKYDKTLLLALWHPVIAPRANGAWVDFSWVPYADCYYFDSAIFDVRFHTASNLITPHDYSLSEKCYHITTLPTRDLTLVLGDFNASRFKVKGGPLIEYYSNNPRPNLLTCVVDTFGFFEKKYGHYPYPNLIAVDVPMEYFKGMEFTGIIFLNKDEQIDEFTLAHEVSHQWWYGLVGNNQLAESWIDEGLANYSAYNYTAHKGLPVAQTFKDSFAHAGYLYSGYPLLKDVSEFPSERAFKQTIYLKGADFWIKLENQVGKARLAACLEELQRDFQHDTIDTDTLLKYLASHLGVPKKTLEGWLN